MSNTGGNDDDSSGVSTTSATVNDTTITGSGSDSIGGRILRMFSNRIQRHFNVITGGNDISSDNINVTPTSQSPSSSSLSSVNFPLNNINNNNNNNNNNNDSTLVSSDESVLTLTSEFSSPTSSSNILSATNSLYNNGIFKTDTLSSVNNVNPATTNSSSSSSSSSSSNNNNRNNDDNNDLIAENCNQTEHSATNSTSSTDTTNNTTNSNNSNNNNHNNTVNNSNIDNVPTVNTTTNSTNTTTSSNQSVNNGNHRHHNHQHHHHHHILHHNPRTTVSVTMNLTLNIHHRQDGGVNVIDEINDAGGIIAGGDVLNPILLHTRERIYSLLFVRVALAYIFKVPNIVKRLFEYGLLLAAILSFALLIYFHIIFIRSPLTCLDHVKSSWPRNGILRVQIDLNGVEADVDQSNYRQPLYANRSSRLDYAKTIMINDDENFYHNKSISGNMLIFPMTYQQYRSTIESYPKLNLEQFSDASLSSLNGGWSEPYVVEYSLEYGLLRLSEEMRRHYNVPVLKVTLVPETNTCFGNPMARFMLNNFLGYDDVLIGSIKRLAEHENNRGYVRNVVTGEHFRFVNVWMTRASYLAAAFIMIVFTLFVPMLVRYIKQQIFIFVSEFLRTLEMQQPMSRVTFLAASLITLILASIGMETIMYEFFSNSFITFRVIIMVCAADQFYSIAIRSPISKRHFLRFFYLYQFAFYAYHYRFNGQYASLALLTTMLFTYHAMLYFLHHYELPLLESMTINRQPGTNPGTPTTAASANNNNNNNNNQSEDSTINENSSSSPENVPNGSTDNITDQRNHITTTASSPPPPPTTLDDNEYLYQQLD